MLITNKFLANTADGRRTIWGWFFGIIYLTKNASILGGTRYDGRCGGYGGEQGMPLKSPESMTRDIDKDAELTQAITGSTYTQSVLPKNSQRQTSPWDGGGDGIGVSGT